MVVPSAARTRAATIAMNSAHRSRSGSGSTTGSPAPAAATAPGPLFSSSTSWPAARNAQASGTVGRNSPDPGTAVHRTRMTSPT